VLPPNDLPTGRLPQAPGGPAFLHPVSVARVGCDAQLTTLLLDEHGVVTDLGRTRRLFPPAHTDAHHRVVHEGGWTLQATHPERGTHGPITITGPHGQRLTSHPRGP
jgi:hypothetical protein